jgi:histidinol-phosphate aminotransferase
MERRERMSTFIDEATNEEWHLPSVLHAKKSTPTYAGNIELKAEGIRQFNLSAGESPFGPPKEYPEILQKITASSERITRGSEYRDVDVSKAQSFIRERFGLSHTPTVILSSNGSYGLLERIPGIFSSANVRLYGLGPHFPSIDKFVTSYRNEGALQGRINYAPISAPLNSHLSETIERAIKFREKGSPGMKNVVFYLCNPGTPKGDYAQPELVEKFAKTCRKKGDLLIVDEAFGDFLPDRDSSIPLTEDYPLIVLRTLSKGIGLPGERIGYAVMHKGIGVIYKETNLLVFDMPVESQMLANEILDPKIINPHLENVREKTRDIKAKFIEKLESSKLHILPTSLDTPILTLDLLSSNAYKRLRERGIIVAEGSGFSNTYYNEERSRGADERLTNRYARITIPKSIDDIGEIVKIIAEEVL